MNRVTIIDKAKGKYFFREVIQEIKPQAHQDYTGEPEEIIDLNQPTQRDKSSIVEQARQKFMQDARDAWKPKK